VYAATRHIELDRKVKYFQETTRMVLLLCCGACAAGAGRAENGSATDVVFQESFANGLRGWRPRGEGFKASAVKSDYDDNGMAYLDCSAGAARAFLGVKAGPTDTVLRFSFVAKSATPGKVKVGLHRYAGPIKWVDIDGTWRRVSAELRSHAGLPRWYIVVPPGAAIFVDAVELRIVTLTDAQKAARRRAYRADSERKAVATYQRIERVRPAPGTSLHVRGEFPIGFFITRTTGDRPLSLDQVFAELAAGGLNIAHNSDFQDWPGHAKDYAEINSNSTAARYIEKAHAAGIGVLMAFDQMMVIKGNLAGICDRVAALRQKPGLYAWYLIDEPSIHAASPQTVRRAYRAIKEVDSAHPVVMTIARTERIADYVDSLDIIVTDVYPVSIGSLFSLVIPIETALSVTRGKKPVWAAIQVHNNDLHHIMRGGETGHMITNPRPPTVREIRGMTYLAIAHGASGILFFAYDGWKYGKVYEAPQRYRGIQKLAREIDGLSRELCGDCLAKGTVRGQNGTLISYIVRGRDEDHAVLVVVNGFDRPSGPVEVPILGGKTHRVNLDAYDVLVKRIP